MSACARMDVDCLVRVGRVSGAVGDVATQHAVPVLQGRELAMAMQVSHVIANFCVVTRSVLVPPSRWVASHRLRCRREHAGSLCTALSKCGVHVWVRVTTWCPYKLGQHP